MNEFKGTKGKWRKFQLPNGNMKITCDDWREFAQVEFRHSNNTEERRKECLYNALLISKAPEMLEKLKSLVSHYEDVIKGDFSPMALRSEIDSAKELMKEATEL